MKKIFSLRFQFDIQLTCKKKKVINIAHYQCRKIHIEGSCTLDDKCSHKVLVNLFHIITHTKSSYQIQKETNTLFLL